MKMSLSKFLTRDTLIVALRYQTSSFHKCSCIKILLGCSSTTVQLCVHVWQKYLLKLCKNGIFWDESHWSTLEFGALSVWKCKSIFSLERLCLSLLGFAHKNFVPRYLFHTCHNYGEQLLREKLLLGHLFFICLLLGKLWHILAVATFDIF